MKFDYWWTENGQSFCISLSDGLSRTSITLSAHEASRLALEAIRTPEMRVFESKYREALGAINRMGKQLAS